MNLKLIIGATVAATITGCFLLFLGWHYDAIGFGINPLVAYPLGVLFIFAPFVALDEK